ncbi:ATP-binding protein [Caballeronia sp. GAOx1]|uniref:ATP-binding protein n=1 Tax=Caballeronia sp. GAOx1 TaxID=2921761 RepID=UPI002027A9D4|nr:ATP-binding protein [Caballeronia sp. GAOx1]
MRDLDWSRTSLGDPTGWPPHLRSALSLCLTSRIPVVMYWGEDFNVLYNDAYISFLGADKHPRFLGAPGRECWREIWHTIGPMLCGVIETAEATWSEDLLMYFARRLPAEEVYVRFSFGPIVSPDGSRVDGIFCPCTETTDRVISERRIDLLRQLGQRQAGARQSTDVARSALDALARNPHDIPFAAVYLRESQATRARLVGSVGPADVAASALPRELAMTADAERQYPLDVPVGAVTSNHALQQLLTVSIPGASRDDSLGLLVCGISSHLVMDDDYQSFLNLVASSIGGALVESEAYEAERRRAEALAEIDRAKTTFFTNVSHEFRTPLTLMLGPLEEALTGLDGRPEQPLVAAAQRNAERLLKMVNTLLEFARVEGGRASATFEPTDVSALTAELASTFRSACEKAGLRLHVDCPPLAQPLYIDREHWERIVLNLVSNAFKFTLGGSIIVAVRTSDDGNGAELMVRDTGTGIPAAELHKLFGRFQRIEGVRGRSFEGSGIGLALTNELVKLHGGAIDVESSEGRGSTFTVRLPFGKAHLAAEKVREAGPTQHLPAHATAYVHEALQWLPSGSDAAGDGVLVELQPAAQTRALRPEQTHRILVADDNADLRAYLQRLLSPHYAVTTAVDGIDALQKAFAAPPDLVLTDVMMPELDGFGLLARLRTERRTRTIPILLLSARAGEEARIDGLAAGADDYLVKPFSARELMARVSAHIATAQLRRDADQAVRASEAQFRALVTATSDIIFRMSPDWTQLRQLFGQDFIVDTLEPSDSWLTRYIPIAERQRVLAAVEAAVRSCSPFELEHRVTRVDGTIGWVFSRAIPVLEDGAIVEWLGVASDVTARKQAEQALLDADRRKDEFLATLAHELRNPLAPIRNALHLFSLTGNDIPAPALREMLLRQVNHMVRLVDDLMEASRISNGKLELQRAPVDLNDVVRTALETSKPLLERGRHRVTVRATEQPLIVDGDEVRLTQVLANLLNNAAKYTDAGGSVEVESRAEGEWAIVNVRDSGIGLSAHQLPRLFEMFAQVDSSHARAGGGLGIGLALAQRLTQMHGGSVLAQSDGLGQGSTFSIQLPLWHATSGAKSSSEHDRQQRVEALRVLVVDDNHDAADSLGMLLSAVGVEVNIAYDGASALATAAQWSPAAVLLDLGMPGMDGWEVARQLRRDPAMKDVKLIALTGWGQDEDRKRTESAGFDHHIVKPVDFALLQKLLASIHGGVTTGR